eukprot:scaffold98880_cov33-Tisochrysis_lutea.AAC.3
MAYGTHCHPKSITKPLQAASPQGWPLSCIHRYTCAPALECSSCRSPLLTITTLKQLALCAEARGSACRISGSMKSTSRARARSTLGRSNRSSGYLRIGRESPIRRPVKQGRVAVEGLRSVSTKAKAK